MAKTTMDALARLRARSPEAGRFVLALDSNWSEKLTEAYSAKRRAEALDDAEALEKATAEVAALETEAGDNVQVFRFRRMGKPEWESLVAAHPLSEEQRKEQETLPEFMRKVWNQDTLAPDLLHRLCIDPKLSLAEATELILGADEDGVPLLSGGEAAQLVNAAVAAATSISSVPTALKLP